MNKMKLLVTSAMALTLGACAAPHKDIASLDARIAEATDGDYGQFLYHQSLAEENLAHARKIRQYWNDDHYWNIDLDADAMAAAERAKQHRDEAEAALIRWHDNCTRHQDLCDRVGLLELLHANRLYPAAYFDNDSAVPKSLNEDSIAEVLKTAKSYPNLIVDVIGYTDTVGSFGYNKRLALRRVDAVSDILRSRGLPPSVRLKPVAIGEVQGPDNTPSQDNRRVDLELHHGGHFHHHR